MYTRQLFGRLIFMMDKQATAKLSTTSDAVKGCMKRDRTSQTAKLNASLASKIKTKLLNNSSMFKVSLKQNNKALALALSVERESSRKLKKEKLFLQKEVEKLQLHNTLLHRKLSCLNKTLVEIEAFLNDNLLAAIEISSLPESFLTLTDGPSNCTDDQLKSTSQSARSVELPVKLPLLTASTGKQQGSPSVYEITNSSKSTTTLSKEMHSDQVKFALSLPSDKNNQKINEVDKVETNNDKNIVLEENHLHGELNCNSAFMTHINKTQSLRQSEELIKQNNDISLPFCGNVPERRNRAALYRSKPQPNIKDFDKKCISDMHHHGSSSKTNYMNLQESSSGLSHIIPSPLEFNSEGKIEFKSMLLFDKAKPEETVYDADMELTASDAGELLTVTSKDKLHQNKNNNANSDKILGNFRRVKYFKSDKEKIKSKTEVSSDLYAEERHARADKRKVSKTTESQTQLFQSQTEQQPTKKSLQKQSLPNTNDYYEAQNCPSKTRDTRRTCLVKLAHPRKQEEKNKETFSETSEELESKIKADSGSSNSKIPPQVYCAESLLFQDNTSNVLPLQQEFLSENEKHIRPQINRKPLQNPSKIITAKCCGVENGQYGQNGSKKSQTERCQDDSKKKQDQKNIIKSKCNKKGSNRQRENNSVHKITEKAHRNSSNFSPGRLKRTLAKASRKAYIMPTKDLTQFPLCKSEELKNKDALCTQAAHGNKITETQQSQVALITQNGVAMNIPQAKASTQQVDDNVNALKGVDSSSVTCKTPNTSNSPDNQVKNKGSFTSGIMETRPEKNYFRRIDQGQLNILDDHEVPHKIDSLMSKLKPTVEKSEYLNFIPVDFSKDMSLNTGSLFQEDLSNLELQALDNPKFHSSINFSMQRNSEILGKNNQDKALDIGKAEQKLDHISKETFEKTLTPGHGRTAFQDLTNTSVCSHTSLPTCPKVLEENSAAPVRRGGPTICYKEPGLRCKLRHGDQFTDTQLLHSPAYKVKNRRSFKSKSKII
ncbi:shugoshin 2 isoform X1 [Anser cygnoides]|uniref:shugoshin 2 isoform X1 n=3 Tax=Anser cygnoides TaxID=8845 RepID=UPI002009D64B|nr:shugoshin 2 [Anser cygnoides]